jgi:lipopolysaccharide biosynthesis glycosyltransferase
MIEPHPDFAISLLPPNAQIVGSGDVVVLCACDENYVRPLAVTLLSAGQALAQDSQLQVYILDGGVSEQSRQMLKETLANLPVTLSWLEPEHNLVSGLKTSHHISHTAYYRLLAARILPASVDKVIYLDCDLVIHSDLSELWQHELNGYGCLAVQDIACPYISARLGCSNYRKACPYMASVNPIPNWQALGLDGTRPYFNSGVMMLNLDYWRQHDVADQLLKCLRDNDRHVWCWDQYALNVVFADNWGELPLIWNQGAHTFEYPTPAHSPVDFAEFSKLLDQPAITHFTTEFKPWSRRCAHPAANLFFNKLDQTAWSQWRPVHVPSLRNWYQDRAVNTHMRIQRWKRRLASLFS